MTRSPGIRLFLILLPAMLAACTHIAPERIQASGNDYNIAIQQSSDEQLLLNLVRLRYRDTPFFLEVNSIASQFKLSNSASLSASLKAGRIPDSGSIGAGIAYTEQPTVSYTPLHGDDFVQRLLSPVSIDTLLLLYNSGWSIERVLRLCVQRMNGIDNAASASGPTPRRAPEFRQFMELSEHLRALQRKGLLDMGYSVTAKQLVPVLSVAPEAQRDPDMIALTRMLQLPPAQPRYILHLASAAGPSGDGSIIISTRSLLGILSFLSQTVAVSAADEQAGRVTRTRNADGTRFDWKAVGKGLFQIHSARVEPRGASVKTFYRGQWFFIDDSDLASKSTFSLLAQLFSLQSGKQKSVAPVLTLPIGQ